VITAENDAIASKKIAKDSWVGRLSYMWWGNLQHSQTDF